MNDSIIIIGAGAAGLMAAKELATAGYKVIVLEANDRLGGRIHTVQEDGFTVPVEAGAEFIHGHLPLTLQLLHEAGISYHKTAGNMETIKDGRWITRDDFIEGWDELMQCMQQLKEDMNIAQFLQTYFSGEKYSSLRNSVQGFTEGFDAADIHTASTFALRDEWMQEDHEQYRITGGYQQLINYLANSCKANQAVIHTSAVVKKIAWKTKEVTVFTADGNRYTAHKVIITVPLGVLQNEQEHTAAIAFTPAVDKYIAATKEIGYGSVVKILLQFQQPFWSGQHPATGFFISDQPIRTWWTQLPDSIPLLTGWLGGPPALQQAGESTLLQQSLDSLAAIFAMDKTLLKEQLLAWKIIDWRVADFALGAYSFDTLATPGAKKLLNTPIEETLFFAGEGLYEGDTPGTVEAALISGREVAKKIKAG